MPILDALGGDKPLGMDLFKGPKPEMFDVADIGTMRNEVFDKVGQAVQSRFPISNSRYTLAVNDVEYEPIGSQFSLANQKKAILKQGSMNRKLYGTWAMTDNATGKVVDKRREILAHVPYLTERGTYIRNGNEYTVAHQSRLKPGVYARKRSSGEHEAHFNIMEGGRSFRVMLDPRTSKMTLKVRNATIGLLPVLRELGMTDQQIKDSWGTELFDRNNVSDDSIKRAKEQFRTPDDKADTPLRSMIERMKLDPAVTTFTLRRADSNVTPGTIMEASSKLLRVSRGEDTDDDRDALGYQTIMSPADLFAERIAKDYGRQLTGKLLWTSTRKGHITAQPGQLSKQIDTVFTTSGLAQPGEMANPLSTIDQLYRLLRTGEGGISSDNVPMESRDVQPSHFGFVDPVRGPESGNVGLDSRFTIGLKRGKDGKLYRNMTNPRTGGQEYISGDQAAHSIISFPGEMARGKQKVRAMVRGKVRYVDRSQVEYELPHPTQMFSPGSNLVPMLSGVAGPRLLMGGKFFTQALPLTKGEAPLVRAESSDPGKTFESIYGDQSGNVRSTDGGRVLLVTPSKVVVETAAGKKTYDLYDNMPNNQKTYITNRVLVKPGDHVKPGQLLAASNYTDDEGNLAIGKNLRVAYMSYEGANFEDAVVISQSASEKLSSEHMYSHKSELSGDTGYRQFVSLYPGKFDKDRLGIIDEEGIVKKGSIVRPGDPLILSVKKQDVGQIHRGRKDRWMDTSEIWEHETPGEIVDVEKGKGGVRISIKAQEKMKVGDKIVGRMGDKGIVSMIVSDNKMPTDADGNPLEVLLNPTGVVTRINPAQLIEAALGKIAAKTGKPIAMPAFMNESLVDFAKAELAKHGLKDTETLSDPGSSRKYKDIMTGTRFLMKLHHMAEPKSVARGLGSYTMEGQPAKETGAKRLGLSDVNALLSHGATAVLRDAKVVRGQKNDNYWRAFQSGYAPPPPEIPHIYKKFGAYLRGAGINLTQQGDQINIMAMTNKMIEDMTHGDIKEPKGVDASTMKELPGGLFDPRLTGGHNGNYWTTIKLEEPMPNPVAEDMLRRMLRLTANEYHDVISGKTELHGMRGGAAIREALKRINVKQLRKDQEKVLMSGAKSKRNDAVKLLKYSRMMEENDVRPEDFVWDRVPVLPPAFRPVAPGEKFVIVADPNRLYVDTMKANEALTEVKKELGDKHTQHERLALYKSIKAVSGLGDPISPQLQNQQVRGLIRHVIGGSPKCYDDNTDVLTAQGWVPWPDYDGTYPVATVNPTTDAFEWQLPSTVIHEPYEGKMVHTKKQTLDLLVTPNHYHYISRRVGRGAHDGFSNYEKISAMELVGKTKRVRYKRAATAWEGTVPSFKEADPSAFAEFVGRFISEGRIHSDDCAAYVCQSPKSTFDVERIDAMFERLGLTFKRAIYSSNGHQCIFWSINDKQLVQWLISNVGRKSEDKYLSAEVLAWSKPYLEQLLVAYLHGDGEKRKTVVDGRKTWQNRSKLIDRCSRFSTTSPHLIDSLQELACKIGLSITLKDVKVHENKNWKTQYRGRVTGFDYTVVEYPEETQLIEYSGSVHCATVLNGLLVVRRNGLVAVSGNSGLYQRRVLGGTLDTAGRAVITPNPSLDMDHVGLPEDKAWTLYEPVIIRRLVREGMMRTDAIRNVMNQSDIARKALENETKERPILINRAPTLHKFNIMAAYPVLVKGHTLQISPIVEPGFSADHDGDTMQYHLPISDDAVEEAKKKMLPSNNLFSIKDFGVHYLPEQEYLHGLYLATKRKKKKSPTVFSSKEEAVAAYRRGELGVDDPIKIR